MENGYFSGQLRSDLGNTTRAATARMGSIGLIANAKRRQHPVEYSLNGLHFIGPVVICADFTKE